MLLPSEKLVFVVDDDLAMLQSVARLLRKFGYASKLFPSAAAFEKQHDFEGTLCVVLDIDLGDGSGIEQRQRLKHENIDVPVIYVTGNDSPSARESAVRSGCLAYLTKPFPAERLMKVLQDASANAA
jgi:FixJ family two-component response regulator